MTEADRPSNGVPPFQLQRPYPPLFGGSGTTSSGPPAPRLTERDHIPEPLISQFLPTLYRRVA